MDAFRLSFGDRLASPHTFVWLWILVLVSLIWWPLLAPGYVLSYDMVWVPRLDPARPEWWGSGTSLPRAVPSDAVLAVAGLVLPMAIVQRLVLVGTLMLAGFGASLLVSDWKLPARLAAATFAIWSTFVAERLVMGHWPLLIGYACLPWIAVLLNRREFSRPALVLALAGTAMTPVSGLMGALFALIMSHRRRRKFVLRAALIVNALWIVPSLFQLRSSRSDAVGAELFASQPEGGFGLLGTVLSLGGIWNAEVVPSSRGTVVSLIVWLALGSVIIAGIVILHRDHRSYARGLSIAAAMGLAISLVGAWWPQLLEWAFVSVPGAGLLRDGSRWVALLMPLYAAACGSAMNALASWWRHGALGATIAVCSLPIAAMPDLAGGVGGRLEPVTYPAGWERAAVVIAENPTEGDIVSLPFSAFRSPGWNHRRTVLDPAGRYFDRVTVTNDELLVSGVRISGEDPRARAVADALDSKVPDALRAEGIAFVVLDTMADGASEYAELLAKTRELTAAHDTLKVFDAGDAEPQRPSLSKRVVLVLVWLISGGFVLGALTHLVMRAVSRALARLKLRLQ